MKERVLEKIYELIRKSQEYTSMDYGEAQWRDGYEQGLLSAIEILDEIK